MVNDVCTLIFKKMEAETEPVAPKEYVNRLVAHMLYTMCFGRKWAFADNRQIVDCFVIEKRRYGIIVV